MYYVVFWKDPNIFSVYYIVHFLKNFYAKC